MNNRMIMIIGLVMMSMFLMGCAKQQVACTMDAKVCPDGSAVGRTGPNCEFPACPEGQGNVGGNTQMANPASEYCIEQGGALKIVETAEGQQGICVLSDGTECDEWAYMRGECTANECADSCPMLSAPAPGWCDDGTVVSQGVNECGCNLPPLCVKAGESVKCTAAQNAAQVCTMEYMPVCGDDGVTYGNKCSACAAGIDSWVLGECPAHVCTAAEKANKACTREYMPVCGSDGVTYGNKCTACSAGIDSWVQGECA